MVSPLKWYVTYGGQMSADFYRGKNIAHVWPWLVRRGWSEWQNFMNLLQNMMKKSMMLSSHKFYWNLQLKPLIIFLNRMRKSRELKSWIWRIISKGGTYWELKRVKLWTSRGCVRSKPDHCVVTKTYCPWTNPNMRETNCLFWNRGTQLWECEKKRWVP